MPDAISPEVSAEQARALAKTATKSRIQWYESPQYAIDSSNELIFNLSQRLDRHPVQFSRTIDNRTAPRKQTTIYVNIFFGGYRLPSYEYSEAKYEVDKALFYSINLGEWKFDWNKDERIYEEVSGVYRLINEFGTSTPRQIISLDAGTVPDLDRMKQCLYKIIPVVLFNRYADIPINQLVRYRDVSSRIAQIIPERVAVQMQQMQHTLHEKPLAPSEILQRAHDAYKIELVKNDSIAPLLRNANVRPLGDYNEFKRLSSKYLAQFTFSIASEPDFFPFLEGKESVVIDLKIVDGYVAGVLGYQDEAYSTFDLATLQISGTFLVGRLYAPMHYISECDSSVIMKTIGHELMHQVQTVRLLWDRAYKMKDQLTEFYKSYNFLGGVSKLYEILFLLYFDGQAMLYERRNTDLMDIDMKHVSKLCLLIQKISYMPSQAVANGIYDNEFCPNSRTGEYYLGRVMCYLIGLAIMKQKRGQNPQLSVKEGDKRTLKSFAELPQFIMDNKVVLLENLDNETYYTTMEALTKCGHYDTFLQLFDRSCDTLGFTEGNGLKFMSYKIYTQMLWTAQNGYKKYGEDVRSLTATWVPGVTGEAIWLRGTK